MTLRGAIFTLVLLGLWAYTVLKSRKMATTRPVFASVAATVTFLIALGGQFLYRTLKTDPSEPLTHGILTFSAWVVGFLATAWIGWILLDLGKLILIGFQWLRRRISSQAPVSLARRSFFKEAGTVGAVAFAGVASPLGLVQARLLPKIHEVDVPIAGLHPDLQGLKIAQISDLHVGPTIHRDRCQQVVELTNSLGADLIAVTGDLVDGTTDQLQAHVEPLGDLKASQGVYYVTGNHEYYWGGEAWVEHFRNLGMTILLNENRIITRGGARVLIGGVPDSGARRFLSTQAEDFEKAAAAPGKCDLRILLAHRPSVYAEASRAGFDLLLSGHTHAGQFFPWSLVMPLAHRYYKGLNRHERLWVYVNSGTGYWGPPNRFLIPSEITLIRLVTEG